MPLFLTDEQKTLKQTIRKFTDQEVLPVRSHLDENEEYPEDIINKLTKDMLLSCPFIPVEYGGAGLGVLETALITEELARGCLGVASSYSVTALGSYPILIAGSEDQKKKIMPDIANGRKKASFALTESSAGSDITNIRTIAQKTDNGYILSGVKQWITGASKSDIYTVFAYTDKSKGLRGLSCFIVEKNSEGLSFGKKENKLGIRCSETREVILENCFVPKQNLVGREGHGFRYVMETLNHSRAVIAAAAVGLSQGAFDYAMQYAIERIQFDNPISSLQSVQHMLADMATQIEAGRHLAYTAARMIDSKHRSHAKYSSMAKSFCAENAFSIANSALQILGGYGYMKDYPIEKMLRDARVLSIYEGTTQIQKNNIAKDLIREARSRNTDLL